MTFYASGSMKVQGSAIIVQQVGWDSREISVDGKEVYSMRVPTGNMVVKGSADRIS